MTTKKRNLKTVLHYYNYDVSKPGQYEQYKAMTVKLKGQGYKCFAAISTNDFDFYNKSIKPLDGQKIEIETAYIFDNQWNSAPTSTSDQGLRLFDWAEAIYPNRDIKCGYYLEMSQPMKNIRRDTYRCGYCGKQYHTPNPRSDGKARWCIACLGKEYLKAEQLPLLRLVAVQDEHKRHDKNAPPLEPAPDWLVTAYAAEQKTARIIRLEHRKAEYLKKLKDDRKKADIEYKGLTWIVEHGLNFENWIYYNHTGIFCYGWRDKPTEQEVKTVTETMRDFPYRWEFKKQ